MANYYDAYGSPYPRQPQAPPPISHLYGYGPTNGPQYGTAPYSSPNDHERSAPAYGGTQHYGQAVPQYWHPYMQPYPQLYVQPCPQPYAPASYYNGAHDAYGASGEHWVHPVAIPQHTPVPPTAYGIPTPLPLQHCDSVEDPAGNDATERQLPVQEQLEHRPETPTPLVDPCSSNAIIEHPGSAHRTSDTESYHSSRLDRRSSRGGRDFRRRRTRALDDSSRIGRNLLWERDESRRDRLPSSSDQYARSILRNFYPHHSTRAEYGREEFLADLKKEEDFAEAEVWAKMVEYNKLSATECGWQSPTRRIDSTYRMFRPSGRNADANSVDRSRVDTEIVAAPPWRSTRVEAARRVADVNVGNAASVEPAAGLARRFATSEAVRRQTMQLAASGDSTDGHRWLIKQLDEVLDMTFPVAYRRVAPDSWSGQWHRNAVKFRELGLFSGPHPRCCETIFTRLWGHLPGEECYLRHDWFTRTELIYMVSNPDGVKADQIKKWLREALKIWIANDEAGHV